MIVPKKKKENEHKLKKCQHEGCETLVNTNSDSFKYCQEHKYRYKFEIKKIKKDDVNQTINHNNKTATKLISKCPLCNSDFLIILLPKVKKYPKYCEEHRNYFKRQLYSQSIENSI